MTSLELGRIGGDTRIDISTNAPTPPVRPLSERLIDSVDDAAWGMSKLIISDPKRLKDPEIAGQAKAEMMKFNALSISNGRVSGEFERRCSPRSGTPASANHDMLYLTPEPPCSIHRTRRNRIGRPPSREAP